MTQQSNILTTREQIADKNGYVTRSWWRFFNSLKDAAANGITSFIIGPNSFLTPGTITNGATITAASIADQTLLGNSSGAPAAASPQQVGGSLSLAAGTLGIAPIAGGTLLGNSGSADAVPGAVAVGDGLLLTAGVLSASSSGGGGMPIGLAAAETVAYWGM
jgi:hypothetical protein